MKSKFTAGPWKVSAHDDTGEQVVRSVSTLNIVCNCEADGFGEVGEAETKANAALISAAPEMYYALTDLCRFIKMGDKAGAFAFAHAYENAIKAIKKAEGI